MSFAKKARPPNRTFANQTVTVATIAEMARGVCHRSVIGVSSDGAHHGYAQEIERELRREPLDDRPRSLPEHLPMLLRARAGDSDVHRSDGLGFRPATGTGDAGHAHPIGRSEALADASRQC